MSDLSALARPMTPLMKFTAFEERREEREIRVSTADSERAVLRRKGFKLTSNSSRVVPSVLRSRKSMEIEVDSNSVLSSPRDLVRKARRGQLAVRILISS